MVYTIKSKCVELPEMEYEDGASTLFLYTKGTTGIPSPALQQLLLYMEETVLKNAVNEELRELHRMVEMVKKDPEVSGMRIQILDENIKMAREIKRLTDENTSQIEKNAKLIDENAKLREELMRRDAAENTIEER